MIYDLVLTHESNAGFMCQFEEHGERASIELALKTLFVNEVEKSHCDPVAVLLIRMLDNEL